MNSLYERTYELDLNRVSSPYINLVRKLAWRSHFESISLIWAALGQISSPVCLSYARCRWSVWWERDTNSFLSMCFSIGVVLFNRAHFLPGVQVIWSVWSIWNFVYMVLHWIRNLPKQEFLDGFGSWHMSCWIWRNQNETTILEKNNFT